MVCFAALGRHKLRDGARRMGDTLGPLLAGPSLPVKEWGSEPDEKQDRSLMAEDLLIGFVVLGIYALGLPEFSQALCNCLPIFFY